MELLFVYSDFDTVGKSLYDRCLIKQGSLLDWPTVRIVVAVTITATATIACVRLAILK